MSFILKSIIKKKIPHWNERIFTEDELLILCKIFGARHFEDEDRKSKGEYLIYKDQPFIVVKKQLKREMRLWVGLHEFGHHLLHYPTNHRFSKSVLRKLDFEANYFAAIALMPTWLVESKTFDAILEDYNYPKELIKIRKYIYDTYKV